MVSVARYLCCPGQRGLLYVRLGFLTISISVVLVPLLRESPSHGLLIYCTQRKSPVADRWTGIIFLTLSSLRVACLASLSTHSLPERGGGGRTKKEVQYSAKNRQVSVSNNNSLTKKRWL